MWAVALNGAREPELVQRPVPTPGRGEVLVRPHCCGICGSDLHARENPLYRTGVVLGHEFTGEVVEVGAGVSGWAPGELVVVNPNGHVCGHCSACRAGRVNLCMVATVENPAGVARDGGMGQFVALHTDYLRRLPEGTDTRRAAWTEPLAVAVRAVRTSRVSIGDRVAVIGGGPIGQLVLQVLRRAGMGHVSLVEPSPFRRRTGEALGADLALTPEEARSGLTAGGFPPVDHVFECSGHPTAVQLAVDLVAGGGSVRLVGMSPTPVAFDPVTALTKEVAILTGFIYVGEFAQAIDLLTSGAVDVDRLTTSVVELDQHGDAFAALRQPESSMKVLIDTRAPVTTSR